MRCTHVEECRWSNVYGFAGVLFAVALVLLKVNFRLVKKR